MEQKTVISIVSGYAAGKAGQEVKVQLLISVPVDAGGETAIVDGLDAVASAAQAAADEFGLGPLTIVEARTRALVGLGEIISSHEFVPNDE